jgi:intermembrane space import and assembly protein 40
MHVEKDGKDTIIFVSKEDANVDVEESSSSMSKEGAIDAEGKINWDCPCLGGLAYGPCGDQFRSAFSCFVYSTDEPKGIECVEKFKDMQDCFKLYPDIYENELKDDEHDDPSLESISDELPPSDQSTEPYPDTHLQKEADDQVLLEDFLQDQEVPLSTDPHDTK